MGKVKLGDIFEIGSGGTPSKRRPEYYQGNIPWVKTGDLKKKYLYEVEGFISKEGLDNSSAKMYDEDTVLIAMYGATIGAASILKTRACTNQACAAFKPNEKVVPEYLYYFLKSRKERFISDGVGGAQPNISSGYLKKVEMEIPTIIRQKEIIKILDDIYDIIEKRKQESIQLDNLIQARFVEMFGDPIINNMSWPESTIGDGCFVTKLAGFEYSKYIEYDDTGDVVMVKAQNVKNGTLNRKDLSFISNEVSDALPRSQLLPGDVVMTYVGANIGDVALIDDKYKYHLAPNVAKIRVDAKIYNSVYFMYMLMFLNSYIVKNSADTAKAALGMERIRKLKVFIPTYDLQNQFAAFVQQVNKSKFVIHKFLYCTTHNTQSIIKPRPNTKESGKTRGGKPYADEF